MIQIIDIELLVPFENHPFKERSGIEQQELTESIKENGLLEPIIARPFPAGKYERRGNCANGGFKHTP